MIKKKVVRVSPERRKGEPHPNFTIHSLAKIQKVEDLDGNKVQWRMAGSSHSKVHLRSMPKDCKVTVHYVMHEPVPVAAYFPFKTKAS